MRREVQISAEIDATTRDLLERHARATGVKKGFLVQEALRHYLRALDELPADVIVRPRVVVTRKSGAVVLREIRQGKPTKALRDLMRRGD